MGFDTQQTGLITATFTLIGWPNGSAALAGKPVKIGDISLTGTASQDFGSGFLSRFAERVRFMLTVPKLGRKC
jgi:hypothetical protein